MLDGAATAAVPEFLHGSLPRCGHRQWLPARPGPARQVPYRVIAALAAAGVVDTAYLTAVKLLHVAPACPLSGGCADILTSDYSNLFGVVPLAAVGLAAYAGMAALAWRGAAATAAGDDAAEAPLRTAVLAGGLALASCSAFLLYVLATQFPGELCPWCLGSAALSFGIAGAAAWGLQRRELADAAAPGAGVVATTLLLMFMGLGSPNGSAFAGGYDLDYVLPAVTTQSPPGAVTLAQRLRDGGARMYGAFWCSHCYDQKQSFGEQAMAAFPYVECYPEGLHKVGRAARDGGRPRGGGCLKGPRCSGQRDAALWPPPRSCASQHRPPAARPRVNPCPPVVVPPLLPRRTQRWLRPARQPPAASRASPHG